MSGPEKKRSSRVRKAGKRAGAGAASATKTPTREPVPDERLREIAAGIVTGTVVTSEHVPTSLCGLVFMPLSFCDTREVKALLAQGVAVVYGDMGRHRLCGGRAVNGYPIFAEVSFLNRAEWNAVVGYCKELRAWRTGRAV